MHAILGGSTGKGSGWIHSVDRRGKSMMSKLLTALELGILVSLLRRLRCGGALRVGGLYVGITGGKYDARQC